MVNSRTLVNALIGAIVGVVLSFVPFSTVLGGIAGGFLEGPDTRSGAIVGALAGAITFLPLAGIAIFGLGVLGFGMGIAAVPFEGFALVALAVVAAVALLFLYTVGLSALGGYLGAYLAREYPAHRVRTREKIGLSAEQSPSVGRTHSSGPQSDSRRRRDRESTRPDARDSRRDRDVERDRR
ncbi:DUF5518 domain-containing protein [Natronorubrum texcoconense]|uniref:DUF5518 domain-containing protein n=1 Tax=Natronorubrum texcoconense TaxID=1095776 RepID=A0A1G9GAA0_9EURY|nr:DUF5518 domain-containing protein [Natronorubrum texcoconense]SDK97654.1 hypothetical protein SAMN04515672_4418 [Natronorubrum texcoconense]